MTRGLYIKNIGKTYAAPNRTHGIFHALSDINISLPPGTMTGITGESGAGKSTLAAIIAGAVPPSCGTVSLHGMPGPGYPEKNQSQWFRHVRFIYQNPFSQLDPLFSVSATLTEAIQLYAPHESSYAQRDAVFHVLEQCRLSHSLLSHYPNELSGGEQQRVLIARALLTHPDLLIADEILSALDPVNQVQILQIFHELKMVNIMSLFISHDICALSAASDYLIVMKDGQIIEKGTASSVFAQPHSAYTKQLFAAALPFPPHHFLS